MDEESLTSVDEELTEFLDSLEYNPSTGLYYNAANGIYYDTDGDEIVPPVLTRRGFTGHGRSTKPKVPFAPENATPQQKRQWIETHWDFPWSQLTPWHWALTLNPDRGNTDRFSFYVFLVRNGVSPYTAFDWSVATTRYPTEKSMRHLQDMLRDFTRNESIWDKIPTFDVITGLVEPPSRGTRSVVGGVAVPRPVPRSSPDVFDSMEAAFAARRAAATEDALFDIERAYYDRKLEEQFKALEDGYAKRKDV